MSNIDLIFNPPENNENQYIQILVGQLRALGYRVHPLDDFFSDYRHFRSIKLVHLNWFENIDDSSFWTALKSFLRKMLVLTVIRISGKKLVWTMHNRASHEQGLSFFSRTITYFLLRWSQKIIIHSHQSTDILAEQYQAAIRKTVYIPHPNFIGVYKQCKEMDGQQTKGSPVLSLLFTGMVKPYKNLELLIQVAGSFQDTVQLTIAGKPTDATYRRQLELLASQTKNVKLLLQFIPDEELQTLIGQSDALVLPYDLSSSLNSGTAILAFSCKKTVICPEIGTITDLQHERQLVFHYSYRTIAEHRQELHKQITLAAALKRQHPETIRAYGDELYTYVKSAHSKELTGKLLAHTYRSLVTPAV